MRLASVILDIPTRALDSAYTYALPNDDSGGGEDRAAAEVGCAVLVPFGRRQAIGYIVGIEEVPDFEGTASPNDASNSEAAFSPKEALYSEETLSPQKALFSETASSPEQLFFSETSLSSKGTPNSEAALSSKEALYSEAEPSLEEPPHFETPSNTATKRATALERLGVDPAKLRSVIRVLTHSYFDEAGAACARFLSEEYIAPLSSCVRLFTPPGGVPKLTYSGGVCCVQEPTIGPVDDRWVRLTPAAKEFVPRKSAVKQRAVLDALASGELRVAELTVEFGAVSSVLKSLEA